MKSSIWPLQSDTLENWAYYNNVFSNDECDKIIEIGSNARIEEATVGNNKINKKIRESYVSWLTPIKELEPTYRKLTDIINELNTKYFKFDLYGFGEAIQFTKYIAPTGRYGKHIDRGVNGLCRKLSVVVQLSDPKNYKGGDLLLYEGEKPVIVDKNRGNVYVFPSYILHEVTPVTKGERCSLVAWLTGPQFK